MATKTDILAKVRKVLDHDRCETHWVLRAVDSKIVQVARVAIVYPRDGAGLLRVAVTDWGEDGNGPAVHHVGQAGGYGYDKRTAALAGATVGGVTIGDHCNSKGDPRVDSLCAAKGWLYL